MSGRRKNGEGTVYKSDHNNNGTFLYVAEKTFTLKGKRIRLRAKGVSEAKAWSNLEEKVAQVQIKGYKPKAITPTAPVKRTSVKRRKGSSPKRDWTFREFALHYYANKGNVSKEVKDKEIRTLELHVFDQIGEIEIRAINKAVVGRYWAELKNGEKAQMTGMHNNVWKILSKVFNYGVSIGLMVMNPLKTVVRGKNKKKDRQVEIALKIRYVNRMLIWMEETNWQEQHPLEYAMLRLNCLGLRTAELCGVSVTNWIDRQEVGLVIDQQLARVTEQHKSRLEIKKSTKTGQVRRLPLPKETEKAMSLYWEKRRFIQAKNKKFDDLFFIDLQTGKPIEPNAYREMLKSIVKQYFEVDNASIKHIFYYYDTLDEESPISFEQWMADEKQTRKWQLNPKQVPEISPKDLRTVAVTKLLDSGASQDLVTALIGNSAAVREKHYYYSQLQAQLEALEAVEQNKGSEKERVAYNLIATKNEETAIKDA